MDFFEHDFRDDVNVVKNRHTEELSYAIQVALNHRALPPPRAMVREGTKIEATVCVTEKTYRLVATTEPNQKNLCVRVFDEDGMDATREYTAVASHCPEHDLCDCFWGDAPEALFRPLQYWHEDRYYAAHELSRRTERRSDTKTFRAYLNAFIKSFRPEIIREGKRFELCLMTGGTYAVRYRDDYGAPVFLSESEQTLFRYLCFLRTAEFWHGFEELRNLHCVKKPMLLTNFLERLDESINTQDLLSRAHRLQRQIIVLTV